MNHADLCGFIVLSKFNKILSNFQGIIDKIHVEEGQKVAKNELVMEFKRNGDTNNAKNSQRSRKEKKS